MRKIGTLLICLTCLWLPWFMASWDKDKPAATTSLRSSNPEMLANNSAIEDALGQDHEFSTGGTNSGKHLQIVFDDPISTPGAVDLSEGWFYTKDVSSKAELHWTDEDENTLQMTSGGDLFSSAGLTVTGAATIGGSLTIAGQSTFNGHINLATTRNLLGGADSDIIFNNSQFSLDGSSGNIFTKGNIDIEGDLDPTSFITSRGGFIDEDSMSTNSAVKVSSQQSIKAYVDAQIAGHSH